MTGGHATTPRPWAERGWLTLHHALAAATLASAVLALEHQHLLEWLDAAMLRVVAPANADPAGSDLPQLVLIDADTYASRFELRSPLDRDRLAEIVDDVLAAHPAALLIDLQLEPAVGETGDRPLDRRLQAAARDPQGATLVVLPLPEHRTPALDRAAVAWMRSMCAAGIAFGSADLRTHLGAVIRVDDQPETLAELTRAAAAGAVAEGHPAGGRPPHSGTPVHGPADAGSTAGAVCQLAGKAEQLDDVNVFRQMLDDAADAPPHTEPLASGALRAIVETGLAWAPGRTREALKALHPRIVVLGGDYDDRDRFLTNAKATPLSGAAVHAGAIASHGRIRTWHAAAWALDVVLGTALGFLFAGLWGRVGRIGARHDAPLGRFLLMSWLRLVAGTGVWLLALVLAYALMWGAGVLWVQGLWMNPGPIVLGMFLHALLLKDAPHDHASPAGQGFTRHAPAWPLQAAVVLITLAVLATAQGH